MDISDLAAISSVIVLIVTLLSIAFSAARYIGIKKRDQCSQRFEVYHRIVKIISTGKDFDGSDLRLASQVAYIYEMRNYPEYADLTRTILLRLKEQWSDFDPKEKHGPLCEAIEDSLKKLKRRGAKHNRAG